MEILPALTLIVSILGALVVLFLGMGFTRIIGRSKSDEEFSKILEDITASEVEVEETEDMPDPKSWTGYWYKLAIEGGYVPPIKIVEDDEGKTITKTIYSPPSLRAAGVAFFAFLIGTFVVPQNVIAGLVLAVGGMFLYRIFLVIKANRRRKLMEKQLPNLINSMRASLQVNLTSTEAFLSQADEIPAPLGDELKLVKKDYILSGSIDEALTNFANRAGSREIKFLVASIKIALSSGSDLDPQLKIIQEIIEQRTRIANALSSAVAQVQPSIWVAGIAIPAGFAFSYFNNPDNQAFWLTPLGLLFGLGIAALYVGGLIIARVMVKKVENA
jgi:tight adherence protein B